MTHRYVGCFGDDENGRQGRVSLADEGVDISACRVASDTLNGMSVIRADERTGERTVLWSRDPGLKQRPEDIDPAAVCAGGVLLVGCGRSSSCSGCGSWELGLPQERQLLVGQPPPGVGGERPVLELHHAAAEEPAGARLVRDRRHALGLEEPGR